MHAVLGDWKHGVGREGECRAAQSEHAGATAAAAICVLSRSSSPCHLAKVQALTHPDKYSSTVKPVNAQFTAAMRAQGTDGNDNYSHAEVKHGSQ